ncbi:uncharacterized protein J3D65DRAFT_602934 [Phyllosticta citribraziliensis]|uniref:BTB domain-containing protein n=1 Tax=Phyllosticta citribraziliensis TaxID=989973 RepID=A0ABR1LSB9_9PEZI
MTEIVPGSSLKGPGSEYDMEWIKRVDFAKSLCGFAKDGFQAKLYSDLTIRCQDKEFYVHKMVLCCQSEFFANACKPDSPFVEARTGIITLDEDDPFIVQLMLDSFYADGYDFQDQAEQRFQPLPQVEAMALSDVLLYAMAEKYRAHHVKSHAVNNFRMCLDREKLPPIKEDDRKPLSVASIVRLATKIFETTPDSDRRLRNLMYLYVKNNFSRLMNRSRFEADMDKVEGFWRGYARFLAFFLELDRVCPKCSLKVGTSFEGRFQDGFMLMQCFYCQARLPVDEWEQPVDDESEGDEGNPRKRRRSLSDAGQLPPWTSSPEDDTDL